MSDFNKALPHLIISVVGITAAVVTGAAHVINGSAVEVMIMGFGGVALGGAGASLSASTAAAATPDISPLISSISNHLDQMTEAETQSIKQMSRTQAGQPPPPPIPQVAVLPIPVQPVPQEPSS